MTCTLHHTPVTVQFALENELIFIGAVDLTERLHDFSDDETKILW